MVNVVFGSRTVSDRELLEGMYSELRRLRGVVEAPVQGLTQKEAAQRLGISTRTLYDLIKKGVVRYSPLGTAKRISSREVERVLTPVAKVRDILPRGVRREKKADRPSAARSRAFISKLK